MAVRLYSNYHNGWRPDSGVVAYTEKHSDARVSPVGVVHEPDFLDAAQYQEEQEALARRQMPEWRRQGVGTFVLNGERCWASTTEGAAILDAVIRRVGAAHGGIEGVYGAFRDDSGAANEPGKDRLGFNSIVARRIGGVVRQLEVSIYPRKGRDGKPESINGSVVEPVIRRAWHQLQQGRLLCPGVGIRFWLSDQCHHNGHGNPLVFIPAGEFGKTVRCVAKMPGVTGLVMWSGYDELHPGGKGMGVPLTAERVACREAFANEGSK